MSIKTFFAITGLEIALQFVHFATIRDYFSRSRLFYGNDVFQRVCKESVFSEVRASIVVCSPEFARNTSDRQKLLDPLWFIRPTLSVLLKIVLYFLHRFQEQLKEILTILLFLLGRYHHF